MPELTDFRSPSAPPAPKPPSTPRASALRIPAPFARALASEGDRGVAARWSVLARYATYLLTMLVCTGVAHAAFASEPTMRLGGMLLLVSLTVIAVTCAVGMVFMPEEREELVKQARHFLFGVVCFPSTGLAIIHGIVRAAGLDPAGQDAFVGMLRGSIPWLYTFATLIPMAVFIKLVAGMKSIHSSRLADEEELRLYTRNDGLQY